MTKVGEDYGGWWSRSCLQLTAGFQFSLRLYPYTQDIEGSQDLFGQIQPLSWRSLHVLLM